MRGLRDPFSRFWVTFQAIAFGLAVSGALFVALNLCWR